MCLNFPSAIVIFNYGPFGGAPKRNTNLFLYLYKLYPDKIYLVINNYLFEQIKKIYQDLPLKNIIVIDHRKKSSGMKPFPEDQNPFSIKDTFQDLTYIDSKTSSLRKIYWYYKNLIKQYSLYRKIEKLRKERDIKVFVGVFSGILPLVFYLNKNKRKAAIIFSDMDSWFSEVHEDMKKLWYRKYYSFNYALENSDAIDFLSPFILEGVKNRGVEIKDDRVEIAPCSFADYSTCNIGEKKDVEVAFCARLEWDKNPLMYLEAAKEILKKYPEIKFHLLGEGSLADKIKKFIDENGLSQNINFQFHKNPPEILRNTSVFVSIQSNTNYPSQSVLEAMACGNAIIASDVGDTEMLITNNNGILIPLNKSNLINALYKLINDREMTRSLGISGRGFVIKNHTVDKYCDYFVNIINKTYEKI
jgi:glycosyltransferase involved in cell wall biosynthesis